MNWVKREVLILRSSHRKYGVALLAFLTTLATTDLVHGTALRWTQITIAGLTAVGVRAVKNSSE